MTLSPEQIASALWMCGVTEPYVEYVDYRRVIFAVRRERGFTSAPVKLFPRQHGAPTRTEIRLLAGMLKDMPCPPWPFDSQLLKAAGGVA